MSVKGLVGEELFASVLIVVLIFVFISALHGLYVNYLNKQDMIERDRVASSIAEKIFFETEGRISSCSYFNDYKNINKVCISFSGCGLDCKSFITNSNEISSSSTPILFNENPGRITVYVKK